MQEANKMSHSQMLTQVLSDERAWHSDTIDHPTCWSYCLSPACLSALEAFIDDLRRYPRPITEMGIPASLRSSCYTCLQPVSIALNSGRGFAIIERVEVEQYTVRELKAMYAIIGQFIGVAFGQDIKATVLYDVRDTGQKVTHGARFSVTSAESTFHMDNSFGDPIPDFVGLLCLQPAKLGGESELMSGYTLHNELLVNAKGIQKTLYQRFDFDRRGQFNAGESPTSRFPIFHWDGQNLTIRYMHYYIQVGAQRANRALTPDQQKALEGLERMLRRGDLRVKFSLQPGQMLFVNNRWILHNRTAFLDHPEPERRRHLVRLWLRRRENAKSGHHSIHL